MQKPGWGLKLGFCSSLPLSSAITECLGSHLAPTLLSQTGKQSLEKSFAGNAQQARGRCRPSHPLPCLPGGCVSCFTSVRMEKGRLRLRPLAPFSSPRPPGPPLS